MNGMITMSLGLFWKKMAGMGYRDISSNANLAHTIRLLCSLLYQLQSIFRLDLSVLRKSDLLHLLYRSP
jgi:hypothetical protein